MNSVLKHGEIPEGVVGCNWRLLVFDQRCRGDRIYTDMINNKANNNREYVATTKRCLLPQRDTRLHQ